MKSIIIIAAFGVLLLLGGIGASALLFRSGQEKPTTVQKTTDQVTTITNVATIAIDTASLPSAWTTNIYTPKRALIGNKQLECELDMSTPTTTGDPVAELRESMTVKGYSVEQLAGEQITIQLASGNKVVDATAIKVTMEQGYVVYKTIAVSSTTPPRVVSVVSCTNPALRNQANDIFKYIKVNGA